MSKKKKGKTNDKLKKGKKKKKKIKILLYLDPNGLKIFHQLYQFHDFESLNVFYFN